MLSRAVEGSSKLVEAQPRTSLDVQGSSSTTSADGASQRVKVQGSRHTHDTHDDDDAPGAQNMDRRATAGDDGGAHLDPEAEQT